MDLSYLYSEIFRAGVKAESIEFASTLADKEALEQLYKLHVFGMVKRH